MAANKNVGTAIRLGVLAGAIVVIGGLSACHVGYNVYPPAEGARGFTNVNSDPVPTVITESLAEGFPRTTERPCTWTTNSGEVAISFVGGGTLTFDFSFAALDPDRLVLDGFEYHRLA